MLLSFFWKENYFLTQVTWAPLILPIVPINGEIQKPQPEDTVTRAQAPWG